MNGGSRIIDFRTGVAGDDSPSDAPLLEDIIVDEVDDAGRRPDRSWIGKVGAALAILLGLAWIGVMVMLAAPDLADATPLTLAGFAAGLCAPPALFGVVWLLALRTSQAEAHRFGTTARRMRAEAADMERMISTLGGAIETHRIQLAEQAQALAAIGDRALSHLEGIGSGLTGQVGTIEGHVHRLVGASAAAEANLGVLLTSVPKAQAETDAMAHTIERAGLAAGEQAAALDAQVVALGERGREADAVAGGAAQRLAAHIARMEATSETAGARLEAVISEMSGAVDHLLGRAAGAMDEARKGIAAQGEAMLAMLEANQAALDRASRESVEGLAQRIAATEAAINRIAELLDRQQDSSDTLFIALDRGIGQTRQQLTALHDHGLRQTGELETSIQALGGSADAMTDALRTGDEAARGAIGTAENLLIALDAAAREIDETLPAAIARLESRITASRAVVTEAKPELLALVTAAESTHTAIEAIAGVVADQKTTLDQLSAGLLAALADGRQKASELSEVVDGAIGRTSAFSDTAAPQLVHALAKVREAADAAAGRARETLAGVIPHAAAALERASAAAIERATGAAVDDRIAGLRQAASDALTATTSVSERLDAQLRAIADATAIIETRIEDAREQSEATNQDLFARRVSLLIESLNSASIDIARAFSQEVADSAWAIYLKGDRGVFTRRAVRLLDPAEARDVHRLYDTDATFRDHVNRYIHDFEAMLRDILAQREGNHLGVTLLSSDMGKLYVALAQSIERLRT